MASLVSLNIYDQFSVGADILLDKFTEISKTPISNIHSIFLAFILYSIISKIYYTVRYFTGFFLIYPMLVFLLTFTPQKTSLNFPHLFIQQTPVI